MSSNAKSSILDQVTIDAILLLG